LQAIQYVLFKIHHLEKKSQKQIPNKFKAKKNQPADTFTQSSNQPINHSTNQLIN